MKKTNMYYTVDEDEIIKGEYLASIGTNAYKSIEELSESYRQYKNGDKTKLDFAEGLKLHAFNMVNFLQKTQYAAVDIRYALCSTYEYLLARAYKFAEKDVKSAWDLIDASEYERLLQTLPLKPGYVKFLNNEGLLVIASKKAYAPMQKCALTK